MLDTYNKFYKLFLSGLFAFQLIIVSHLFNDSLSKDFGILSDYIFNEFAFNELSFWSHFQSDIYPIADSSNPLYLNLIGLSIFLLSKIFSSFFIFTFLPFLLLILNFWLILRILEFYSIPKSWAYLLAFLGLTSVSELTLWQSLLILFAGNGIPENYNNFDLLYTYSGTFTLFSFLTLFNFTLRTSIQSNNRSLFLPAIWGATILIHPSIFIFGFTFLLILYAAQAYKNFKNRREIHFVRILASFSFPLIFVIPYLVFNINFFGSTEASVIASIPLNTFIREAVTYCLAPIFMMIIFSYLFRIDPYEQVVRFWPIIVLSLLEISFRFITFLELFSIDHNYIIDNISIYFLHFFYYVPFLSIISRKPTYRFKNQHTLDNLIQNTKLGIYRLNLYLGPVLAVFFTFFIISSQSVTQDILVKKQDLLEKEIYLSKLKEITESEEILRSKNGIMLSPHLAMLDNFLYRNYPQLNSYLSNGSSLEVNNYVHAYMLAEGKDRYFPISSSYDDKIMTWLIYNRINQKEDFSLQIEKATSFFNNNFLISHKELDIQSKIPGIGHMEINLMLDEDKINVLLIEDDGILIYPSHTHHIYYKL